MRVSAGPCSWICTSGERCSNVCNVVCATSFNAARVKAGGEPKLEHAGKFGTRSTTGAMTEGLLRLGVDLELDEVEGKIELACPTVGLGLDLYCRFLQ
jgi:hypothetical protein